MILWSALLGIGTGTLLGLLGGGGSIIAVPILVYILRMEAKAAIGTSLLIVGISSFLASFAHYQQNHVRLRTALVFGSAGCCGSFLGAEIGKQISDTLQLTLFAIVMGVVGALMLLPKRQEHNPKHVNDKFKIAIELAAGGAAGILTGLLGVGGGFIIVPALAFAVRLPIKQAIGTSLLIIALNSVVSVITYAPFVRFSGAVLPFAAGTMTAAPIAGHFASYIHQDKLKTAFAVSLLVLAIWMCTTQLSSI